MTTTAEPELATPQFSLELNEDQLLMKNWVHEFAENVIRPAAAEWDEREETPWPILQEAAKVERGRYLVSVLGCNDCHTPLKMGARGPEPDMTRMLSGHPEGFPLGAPPAIDPATGWAWAGNATNTAFVGPWGVSYARNLTPDEATGMGIWTEEMFIATVRTGRHQGKGRVILPPMPVQILQAATDEDLKDIFAYLQSIPAIRNKVPTPVEAE